MGSNAGEVDNGSGNITKEFLEEALKGPIISYKIKKGTELGDNYTSLMHAIEVTYKDKSGDEIVENLLLKTYPSHPARQIFLAMMNIFWKELQMYDNYIPELKRFQKGLVKHEVQLPFPPFVAGKSIDLTEKETWEGKVFEPLDHWILMKDMRPEGFRMTSRHTGFDLDHMTLVIKELAKIHSISWVWLQTQKEKYNITNFIEKFPNFKMEGLDEEMAKFKPVFDATVAKTVDISKQTFGEDHVYTKAVDNFKVNGFDTAMIFFHTNSDEVEAEKFLRVKRDIPEDKYEAYAAKWNVTIHGDCWVNNMIFKYDDDGKPTEIILVDLQVGRQACPTIDLAYLLYTSTTGEFRRRYLDDMLQLYTDTFLEICNKFNVKPLPGFSLDALKFRLHRSKLLGFYISMSLLPIILKDKNSAIDLEQIKKDAEITDFLDTLFGHNDQDDNQLSNLRLCEIIREVYEAGII